ncbi:hypothetical protein [Geodermatophilus marinus]|uniref:hypothetical protein n=1 Tax=Geodermatophilus sp. LHW52908 TaxID=2303986 RepID=UPI0011C1AC13|nr:hypothetical protein [Geodermatophilus sp. LHW52908]
MDLEAPRYAARLLPGWSLVNGPVFPWCENAVKSLSPSWSARRDMGEGPSSYLDVTIGAAEVPRAVAAVPAPVPALSDEDDELDALLAHRMDEAFEELRSAGEEPDIPARA